MAAGPRARAGDGHLNAIQPKIQHFIAEHRSRFRIDPYDTTWPHT